jgi:hypothetical protein
LERKRKRKDNFKVKKIRGKEMYIKRKEEQGRLSGKGKKRKGIDNEKKRNVKEN